MATERASTYDLSGLLDVPGAADIDPGTNILITGPTMTGKDAMVTAALVAGLAEGDGAVYLTTNGTAGDLLADLEAGAPEAPASHVSVIDCRADGQREETTTDDGATVHHVGSPADFTALGVGISRSFEALQDRGVDRARFGLTSLSTMLTYADPESVFKFCHVLSSQLDTAGYLGLFTLDAGAHGDQTLELVTRAFDARIEIREADGGREARIKGVRPDPSPWVAL